MALINLDDKVAIVSGASRGIGEAIALAYAEAGAKVVVSSRKQEGVDQVAEKIRAAGGDALPLTCHVGRQDQRDALIQQAVAHYGRVDVLVNCAGTNPYFGPMIQIDEGAYLKTFEVNLQGAFDLTKTVAQHLVDRKAPGSVVNIASVAGLRASPLQGVYGMTKAAMIAMTRNFALELGPSGIRINAIAPGLIETRLAAAILQADSVVENIKQRAALGRIGQPEEIAGAALFLASDSASYVTGQTLVVDGGLILS